jgi:hypothetical protein
MLSSDASKNPLSPSPKANVGVTASFEIGSNNCPVVSDIVIEPDTSSLVDGLVVPIPT